MSEPNQVPGWSDALARGPLLLDAAMGTRLIAQGLDLEHDDPALWNLTQPETVAAIHERDVAAGSDAILTNTFGANRAWLARFACAGRVVEINRRAVALARQAAGRGRFVLGCLGPSAAPQPEAYIEQAMALAEAGVDALLFETHRVEQAEVALHAVRARSELPLLISLAAWPDETERTARRLVDLGASALGCNCQAGMGPMLEMARRLAGVAAVPLITKPNAGLPDEPRASPESFAQAVPALLDLGVRLIGGCCGTTEAHVAALRAPLDAAKTRT